MAKILVADDNHLMTWSISRTLAREGYQVRCVDSLDGARKAAEEDEFDVIITDLVFPDGWAMPFLGHMGQASRNIPVILMTGHGCREVEEEARSRGVRGYLEKPFAMVDLRNLVRQALQPPAPSPHASMSTGRDA